MATASIKLYNSSDVEITEFQEADIVAGGCYVEVTLVDDTWIASGVTYVFQENFEETNTGGALGSATDGIDSSSAATFHPDYSPGTTDRDYSTSGLSMEGSQCLRCDQTDAGGLRFDNEDTNTAGGGTYPELYVYFLFRTSADLSSARMIFAMQDTTSAYNFKLNLLTNKTLQAYSGTGFCATVGTLEANTTYHIWCHYKNDGNYYVAFAPVSGDGTRPTSGDYYVSDTDGSLTSGIRYLYCKSDNNTAGVYFYYDKIRASTSEIGNNPA